MMYPLLVMSLIGLTLALERAWFWWQTNSGARQARFDQVARCLRKGDRHAVIELISGDNSVYADVVQRVIDDAGDPAVLAESVEMQRSRIERFMPTLSTIITAAPMIGILGTVLGIIDSFHVLSLESSAGDPRAVSAGIAQALLTTAAGLAVALLVLFPYNACRAQIDRSLGRLETLVSAAEKYHREHGKVPHDAVSAQSRADG